MGNHILIGLLHTVMMVNLEEVGIPNNIKYTKAITSNKLPLMRKN